MTKLVRIPLWVLLVFIPLAPGVAQDISGQEMRSLDGQVQEIKSDVLSIASELGNLEERLLYPSNTQVALFVAMNQGARRRNRGIRSYSVSGRHGPAGDAGDGV